MDSTPGLRNTGSCGRAVAGLRMVWNAIIDPQFRGVLHKPRIGIVPDPFLVKAVWLRETNLTICIGDGSEG